MTTVTEIQLTGNIKGVLDIDQKSAVPIVYQVADIRDLSSKSGATSRTIILADTKNNHNLLGQIFDINQVTLEFDLQKVESCILLQNGVPIMNDSVIQLISVEKDQSNGNSEQAIKYECVVKDKVANFFTALGNAELTDLRFDWLNHIYSSENIINSWDHTSEQGYTYVFPLTTGTEININNFRLGIFAKKYLDLITARAGYNYEWDGHDNEETQFHRYVIPYNGDVPKLRDEVKNLYNVEAYEDVEQEATGIATNQQPATVAPFQLDITNEVIDSGNIYNPTTSIYTSPFYYVGGGSCNFYFEIDFELILDNTSGATAYMVGGATNYQPKMYLGKNAFPVISSANMGTFTNVNASTAIPAGETLIDSGLRIVNLNGTLTTDATTFNFKAGVQWTTASGSNGWRATNTASGTPVLVNTKLVIKSVKLVANVSMSEIGYNQTVYVDDFIPKKIKQSDFIKSILTMNNCLVTVNKFDSNKLQIKSRDQFYDEGKVVDWTKKLDKSKKQVITFLPSLSKKKIQFTYKEDKDQPNEQYKKSTDEIYGQVEFTYDSEHEKDIEKKEIIFSPTPITQNDLGAVVPMINGIAPKNNIRCLLAGTDGEAQTVNTYKIVDYLDSSGNSIGTNWEKVPLFSHFNKAQSPTFDINFATCDYYFYALNQKTNQNLFNLKWRRTIGQINSGHMLTAYFDLDENDISNMELSDKIFIGNAYFNINKIEYNANSKGSTKVELLTADNELDLAKFRTKKPSIPHSGDVVVTPGKDVIGDVLTHSNVVVTKEPTIILGKNNYISESVKSAIIQGNGNTANEQGLIVGDGLTLEKKGIITENLTVVRSVDFNESPKVRGVEIGANKKTGVHAPIQLSTGWYYNNAVNAGAKTTSARAGNIISFIPIQFAEDLILLQIGFETTAGSTGNLGKILIYNSLDGLPNEKIIESSDFNLSAAGLKLENIYFEATGGVTYYAAVINNSASTVAFRAIGLVSSLIIRTGAGTTNNVTSYTMVSAFGTEPTTIDQSLLVANTTTPIEILFKT